MQKKLFAFLLGAAGYCGIEIASRGFTHWSMALTGGACFLGLLAIAQRFAAKPLWVQALLGGALITGAEFCVGVVVNLLLGWQVWDYSDAPFQILGQICLQYTFYWCLLSYCVCLCVLIARTVRARLLRRYGPPAAPPSSHQQA